MAQAPSPPAGDRAPAASFARSAALSTLPADVSEADVKREFERFLRAAAAGGAGGGSGAPSYAAQLAAFYQETRLSESRALSFAIDLQHVLSFSPYLMRLLVRFPAEILLLFDEVAAEAVAAELPQLQLRAEDIEHELRIAVRNHPRPATMRDLDPQNLETLVAVRGVVIRVSSVIPDMRVAAFKCVALRGAGGAGGAGGAAAATGPACGFETTAPLVNGQVSEPDLCPACGNKFSLELNHAKCVFGNKQLVKLQEAPEAIPEGETPQTLLVYAFDDLVDCCKPGDHVEVCGVLRASGVRVLPRQRALKSVYRTFVDASSISQDASRRFMLTARELEGPSVEAEVESGIGGGGAGGGGAGDAGGGADGGVGGGVGGVGGGVGGAPYFGAGSAAAAAGSAAGAAGPPASIPPSSLSLIQQIAQSGRAYQTLVKSFAPNIWETDEVKKGLLCQLFGGTPKVIAGRSSRSDIHVLLCGDPSTAKSQLLKYVHSIAPRGAYTCGRGSSAVGLTAAVTRDLETKEFVLESGAIILSDRGICCIDEFDKMQDTARSVLHEVLEQQSVSIAKAGIVCSLNARTALLASANPIGSRYDATKTVVENINLPASLLSRFDLIYLMLDCPNEKLDHSLAAHICGLFGGEDKEAGAVAQAEAAAGAAADAGAAHAADFGAHAADFAAHAADFAAAGADFAAAGAGAAGVGCAAADAGAPPPILPRAVLAQYISHARQHCFPRLSPIAKQRLAEAYLRLRGAGGSDVIEGPRKTVTATPRQLEALIRVAEALAKMELAATVTEAHVEEANRLIRVSTYSSLVDPSTGRIDFAQLAEGAGAEARQRRAALEAAITKALEGCAARGLEREALADQVNAQITRKGGFPVDAQSVELLRLLREMEECGLLRLMGNRYALLRSAAAA